MGWKNSSSLFSSAARVTRARLEQIGALEAEIHALGIRQARVRWHAASSGETLTDTKEAPIARIEIGRDELPAAFDARDAIVAAGKRLGFAYVTLDLAGYRTGSHNEVLHGRSLRVVS